MPGTKTVRNHHFYDKMLFIHANYFYNFGFNVTCITGARTEFNIDDNTLLKAPSHEWKHFENTRQSIDTLKSYDWNKAVGLCCLQTEMNRQVIMYYKN